MNTIKFKKYIVLLLLFLLSSCILFEDENKRTYFNQEATGYVYYYKTKAPAPNVWVTVSSTFPSGAWASKPDINEYFYTDNAGFFRIKFLKRTQRQDIAGISVCAYDSATDISSVVISCTVDKLDEFILNLDTLWLGQY